MPTRFCISRFLAAFLLKCLLILLIWRAAPAYAQNIQWQQTNGPYGGYIRCFGQSGSTLFAGTNDGGIYRSSNNGLSWEQVNTGLTNKDVRSLIVSGSTLFAGTSGGGVYRSDNNGSSWEQVNMGLTSISVTSLTVSGNGTIFAGTFGGGLYRSSNNGSSWEQVNTGLMNTSVQSLTVSGSTIFAGTDGGGVYKANIGTVSVRTATPHASMVNISFAPHPVLDRTRLTIDLPVAARTEISIVDALGRLVQQRLLGELSAGTHDIEQDFNTLPNGTYGVVVQAGSERAHKLLQVIR